MWLLVVNRHSGRGKVAKKLEEFQNLCDMNDIDYEIIDEKTADKTDLSLRSKLDSESVDAVVAFGGDGLVSVCLQSLANTGVGFSIVPTGTGNDFARSIDTINKSVNQIFDSIFQAVPETIDLGLIESQEISRYFIQVVSVGFDASVNELANSMRWPKGKIKYTIAMLRLLPKVKNTKFSIEGNGHLQVINSMLIAIANGSTYGGGMKILPKASFNDGLLDLLYVDPVSKFTLLSIFPRVFRGTHVNHRAVHLITSKDFVLRGEGKAYADGEYVNILPVKISVVRDSLKTWICK